MTEDESDNRSDKRPRLPMAQRAVGIAAVVAAGAIAYLWGDPKGPYTPQLEPPGVEAPAATEADTELCALEEDITDLLEDVPSEMQRQMHQAIIHHESGCDPYAVSRTGAAGLAQLTVQTGAGRGLDVYAPEPFFRQNRWDFPRFRTDGDSIPQRYRADLMEAIAEADPADVDERFDPEQNVEAYLEEFNANLSVVSRYVSDEVAALRITAIAHNAGISDVDVYLMRGAKTPEEVLEMTLNSNLSDEKKSEVQQFYTNVNALFERYGGPEAPERHIDTGFTLVRERNSQGDQVYRVIVQTGDTRSALARSFNDWDDRSGDAYARVTFHDVVSTDGSEPSIIHAGDTLYVTASSKRDE